MNYCQFRNDFIKRMANSAKPLLPPEYQQVEYLESSYTQYIDTLFAPTVNNLRIVTKMSVQQQGNSSDGDRFFGSQNGSACSIAPWFSPYHGGTRPLGDVAVGQTYYIGEVNTSYGTIYDIDLAANNGSVTGNYCGKAINETYIGTVANSLSIYIFGLNMGSYQADRGRCYARFYMFDIYSNGDLKFSGIPCYRKSDNKPGMYDLVTKTFFTNAGTGEFTVGNNV